MASEALRRLAARVSKASETPYTSDTTQFEGSRGSRGSASRKQLENIDFFAATPGTPGANLGVPGVPAGPKEWPPLEPVEPVEHLFWVPPRRGQKQRTSKDLPALEPLEPLEPPKTIRGGGKGAARSAAKPGPTQPDEPGLSPHTIRELANWYEEEGNRRRVGLNLDQDALDRDLRQRLAERGVLPEFISTEFEHVMKVVFPGSAPDPKPQPDPHEEHIATLSDVASPVANPDKAPSEIDHGSVASARKAPKAPPDTRRRPMSPGDFPCPR